MVDAGLFNPMRDTFSVGGRDSREPDGTITTFRWAETKGATLPTQATFTKVFTKVGGNSAMLNGTDNGGLMTSRRVRFTALR